MATLALERCRARVANLSSNQLGILWILGFCLCSATVSALIKIVSAGMPSMQIAFIRALLGFIVILPFLAHTGRAGIMTARPGAHLIRGLIGTAGLAAGFYSIVHLELAEATAIGFTKPLFIIVLAALFLGEVVRARRWSATAVGFIGVLIMFRPGVGAFEPAMVIGLIGALAGALVSMTIRSLSRSERPTAILFYFGLTSSLILAIPAAMVWQTPSLLELLLMVLVGAVASGSQLCLIRGYHAAEASALAPFEYAMLPIAMLYGFALFGEIPDLWALLGAGLIVLSTLYIARREASLGKPVQAPRVVPPGGA
ncbi:DMT family transporter [Marinivivus vitaminiproducens]|uniref:DMT family transporter n=1 Tax=Marinivivus vitaminiproducens TaxID=3035935 RepID=UPI00279E9698|nr:DMT family transporter [Geminicoccaceae bacterium SCSIO 64248]